MLNQIELVNIEEITPYNNNPRDNENSVEYVANSIKEFGFIQPIVVDSNKVIIAGHTRYKASQKLGLKQVPIIIADNLSEEQVKAYRIADNSTGDNSKWIDELLYSEIADIEEIDMSTLGINLEDLNIDDLGTDFDLPSGDKDNVQQITFTLTNEQMTILHSAMDMVDISNVKTYGNENSNGNKLFGIVSEWIEQKKS